MGANLFSASEIGLTRSREQLPNLLKTLFLLEHLRELVTCTNPHVLGLVFLNASEVLRLSLRLTAELPGILKRVTQFNFVVKHRVPVAVPIGASPEALETLPRVNWIQARTVSWSASWIETT